MYVIVFTIKLTMAVMFSVQVVSYVPNFNVKVTNILRVSSVKETMTAGDFNVK